MSRLFLIKRLFTAVFIAALFLSAFFYRGDHVLTKNNPTSVVIAPITVVKNNPTLSTDVNGNGVINPGDTLTYTVTVSNGATDATGVIFTDVLDSNLTLVPGSVNSSPIATNESYSVLGNVSISVPAGSGVKINDLDPDGTTPTITGFGATMGTANGTAPGGATTTANGGNITLNADGSFTYNPPAGFEGTGASADSFFYTLSDGTASDTAQVSLNVSGMIWFINNASGSCTTRVSGCGRLSSPYSSLAAFQAENNGGSGGLNPSAGDNIFIFTGGGNYDASVSLLNNQKLIGQGASATLQSIAGVTVPAHSATLPSTGGTNPTIITTAAATNAVNVGQNNTLRGLTIGNTTGSKLNASASVGTLTIGPAAGTSDVTLNGTGRAVNLTGGGTLAARFASIAANGGTNGIVLTGMGGSLESPTTSIQNSTSTGISVSNSVTGGTFNFGNTTSSSSAGSGVLLSNNANSLTFGSLNITPNAGQRAFQATNNTGTITTTSGTISTSNNIAVEIIGTSSASRTPLNMQLINVSSTGSSSGIILTNTSSTGSPGGFRILGTGGAGTGGAITNSTGPGVNLTTVANAHFTNFNVQNGGDDGIRGSSVTDFSLTSCNITGNGNAVTERGIDFTNLLGTASITNSSVSNNAEDNLYVKNGTGILNLTTSTTTYANTSASIGNDGIHFLGADVSGSNNANMTITVTNCTFTNNRGDHFQALTDAASAATQTIVFQNNDLNNTVGTNLGAGLTINPGGTANVNFNISNNGTIADPFTGAFSSAITINSSNNSTMSGTINNNVIGNPAITDSGSFSGDGITVFANNTSDITVAITNNRIREYSNLAGINIHVRDGVSDTINATITGNTISDPGSFASHGIFAQAGSVAGDTGFLCIDIGSATAGVPPQNSIAGSGANGATDFRVRQRINTTVQLPGYAGANNNDAAVVSFIQGRNSGAETGSATNNVAGGGGGFVGGAACTQPTLAFESQTYNKTSDNFANYKISSNIFYQSSDLLSGTQSFFKLSDEANSISNHNTAKTETKAENDKTYQITKTDYLSDIGTYFGHVSSSIIEITSKIGSLVSPTVHSQQVDQRVFKAEQNNQLAGETVCVDGNTDPNTCAGGFTIPANESTTITFRAMVNANTTATSIPNTANVTAAGGINQNSNTVNTPVVQPPLVAKDFAAQFISVGGTTNLNFTITNPNSIALTGVSLTDVLPAGLSVTDSTASVCAGTNNLVVTAATRTIQLTGATVPANNGTCTFSVTVTGTAEGEQVNLTGNVNSTQGGQGGTATDTVTVINPPNLAKSFTPNQIQLNGTSTLQFTLSNPNSSLALNTLAFTDSLPSGVTAPNTGATTVCTDGSYSISSNVISFTKPTLAAGSNCIFSVVVSGATAGVKTNTTSTVTTDNSNPGTAAVANVTVIAAPTIEKAFAPSTIVSGGMSTVTLVLSNPNTTGDLTNASFTDTLMNMSSAGGAVGGTCVGTTPNTLSAGATALSFSGITIPNNSSCTVTFDVTSSKTGSHPNQTSGVTTNQTPLAGAASNTAMLNVGNTVTWTGATSTNWNTATNWSPAAVPTSTNNVLIPSIGVTNEPGILTNEPDVTVNALEIQTNRTLTIQSGRNLTVTNALTNNGTINNAGSFTFGMLNAGGTVNFTGTVQQTLPAGLYDNLMINNTAGVVLAGDVTVNNLLTLTNGNVTTGANTLIISASASISRTSGHVIGNLRKDFAASLNLNETFNPSSGEASALPPVFVFPVGTANGFSPATIDIVTGSGSFTVSAMQDFLPGADQTQSIQRFWTLASNGITEANITFQYLDADVPAMATEANFKFIRRMGTTNESFMPSSLDTATNTFTLNGVTQFSDWTLGNLVPTAANVSVSGRVLKGNNSSGNGAGVAKAIVTMTDLMGNSRSAMTNPFGFYQFDDVEAGQTYIFEARAKGRQFAPQVVMVNDEITDLNFIALP